jgi:thiol-disulfide isomerase/thioredoxin
MKTYFELLLNNGDEMEITAAVSTLPLGIKYVHAPENERFQEYVIYLKNYSARQQKLVENLAQAKSKTDTANVRAKSAEMVAELRAYRTSYIAEHPHTLLANIFGSLFVPDVPGGKHLLKNGKEDTAFAFNYYKEHYWDNFDFTDDRLMYTPVYHNKLENYFTKVVPPLPDSVQKEADILLKKARGRKELFKYTLHWVTQYAQESKVMGMDQAFVYFIENYHMKGDAYWMDKDLLSKYVDRAQKIAPNVLGNLAPDIKMLDWNKNPRLLSEVKAKYTLLVFWAPDCGGCQKEMPVIDSLYKKVLKNKGVKIYAVRTEGDTTMWKNFVEKHDLTDWVHVYDPEHKSNYKAQYDVYGTPSIYLLDEKKIIRGKKLDHNSILKVIEMEEAKSGQNKKS